MRKNARVMIIKRVGMAPANRLRIKCNTIAPPQEQPIHLAIISFYRSNRKAIPEIVCDGTGEPQPCTTHHRIKVCRGIALSVTIFELIDVSYSGGP